MLLGGIRGTSPNSVPLLDRMMLIRRSRNSRAAFLLLFLLLDPSMEHGQAIVRLRSHPGVFMERRYHQDSHMDGQESRMHCEGVCIPLRFHGIIECPQASGLELRVHDTSHVSGSSFLRFQLLPSNEYPKIHMPCPCAVSFAF